MKITNGTIQLLSVFMIGMSLSLIAQQDNYGIVKKTAEQFIKNDMEQVKNILAALYQHHGFSGYVPFSIIESAIVHMKDIHIKNDLLEQLRTFPFPTAINSNEFWGFMKTLSKELDTNALQAKVERFLAMIPEGKRLTTGEREALIDELTNYAVELEQTITGGRIYGFNINAHSLRDVIQSYRSWDKI